MYIIREEDADRFGGNHSKSLSVDGPDLEVEINGNTSYFFLTKNQLDRLIMALQKAREEMGD